MKVVERNATVWKVVSAKNGKLLSALTSYPLSWVVEYRLGRWAYPKQKGSALFAFDDYRSALIWTNGFSGSSREVWQGKADIVNGELSSGGRLLRCFGAAYQSLRAFWLNPQGYSRRHGAELTPSAGVWCKRIRLEKRV